MKRLMKSAEETLAASGFPDRAALQRAERILFPTRSDSAEKSRKLLETSAAWIIEPRDPATDGDGFRARTMRRRGSAQCYPWQKRLERATEGTLALYAVGLALEPKDTRQPCINLPASAVTGAEFYGDAVVLATDQASTITIRTDLVDAVDSIIGAYFWNTKLRSDAVRRIEAGSHRDED